MLQYAVSGAFEDEEAEEVDGTEKSSEDEEKDNGTVGTAVPQGKDSGAWLSFFLCFHY